MKNSIAFGGRNREFTPLPDTLYNIMFQLVNKNMISLPPIKAPNPNKTLPRKFRSNSYFHYHQKNGHDREYCKHLKHLVQELIDNSRLLIGGVND
jgi:hypothetical protein